MGTGTFTQYFRGHLLNPIYLQSDNLQKIYNKKMS